VVAHRDTEAQRKTKGGGNGARGDEEEERRRRGQGFGWVVLLCVFESLCEGWFEGFPIDLGLEPWMEAGGGTEWGRGRTDKTLRRNATVPQAVLATIKAG
jgi:hypothetical protein